MMAVQDLVAQAGVQKDNTLLLSMVIDSLEESKIIPGEGGPSGASDVSARYDSYLRFYWPITTSLKRLLAGGGERTTG